uniref:Uncharacterized protein n=1 Tax=Tanacetum cinerariifolium TaxID=118510 RepID=A0A699JQU3_TANCI|nr:hypothetical protein [Tanacetum cinerariifolium]
MIKTSSSSKNKPCCSKACKKNTKTLNSKITEISDKLADKVNLIYHYKLALAQVVSRLVEYKEGEVKYIEKIRTLEYYDKGKKECIESLRKELETLKQEKEVVDGKLAGLLTASKDLDNLIESQRSDMSKEECADDTVTDYSRLSPTVESTSGDDQNRNSSASENGESTDSILSKPAVKFVKAAERPTTDKVKTAKKPAVRYAEPYKKTTKRSTVRGNHQNWNNLKSQQLGVKKRRTCPTYTHKNMPPRPSTHRPYRPLMRPNMNSPRPNKPAHSYGRRPFPHTTQELMIILIQRVQRLERELKARTPKVDRGRSRCSIKFRGGLLGSKSINSRNLIADAASSLGERLLNVLITLEDLDLSFQQVVSERVRSFDLQKNHIQDKHKKKMIKTSSSSKNKPCCSKACKKNTKTLNSKITEISDKLADKVNLIYHYKLALAQVVSRLVEYKEGEVKYIEKIRTLEYYDKGKKEFKGS